MSQTRHLRKLFLGQVVDPLVRIFSPTDKQCPAFSLALIPTVQVAIEFGAVALAIKHHDQLLQPLSTHARLFSEPFGFLDQLGDLLQQIF